ncbi:MAG TPA: ELWxxDGT repeat protein [Thermoanaerobaculia bacterium]
MSPSVTGARLLTLVCLALLHGVAWAQPPYLIKDISPGTSSFLELQPGDLTRAGDLIFFWANSPAEGFEVWRTDGTPAGTFLLQDIFPGPDTSDSNGSDPNEMAAVGDVVYFVAKDGGLGGELWRSDGTPGGTVLVRDIVPGPDGPEPRNLTPSDGLLFFIIWGETNREELWRTDGTEAGTFRLQPAGSDGVAGLTDVDGTLFFFSYQFDPFLVSLWTSDGTPAGTVKVTDLAGAPHITAVTALDGELFFVHALGDTYELWMSDGTAAGTVRVKILPAGTYQNEELTAAGGLVFLRLADPEAGSELWRSDGTEAGTFRVKDIRPGPEGSFPNQLTAVGGLLFFSADDGASGFELWKSDGTEAGTALVEDISPGYSYPLDLTAVDGLLFFSAYSDETGSELWVSDGTAAGTRLVKDILPDTNGSAPTGFAVLDGRLYFVAYNSQFGREPWVSDGTEAGTHSVFEPVAAKSTRFGPLTDANGTLYFRAEDEFSTRCDLWRSDGTGAGTVPVLDAAGRSVCPLQMEGVGSTVFFHNRSDSALWKSDGAAASRLSPEGLTFGWDLAGAGGLLFFAGCHPATGCELWKSDGTAAGTVLVKDLQPGTGHAGPSVLTAANGLVFFRLPDGLGHLAIWRSDGTAAGTFPLKTAIDWIPDMEAGGGLLYFFSSVFSSGDPMTELWRSDGTPAGTFRVLTATGTMDQLTAVGSAMYFRVYTEEAYALWKSDGTSAWPVKRFPRGTGSYGLTGAAGLLFFAASDEEHGRELWVSDGTEAGTRLVKDIFPGDRSSVPDQLAAIPGGLVFAASDDVHGQEVWRSDGTAAGTFQLPEIAPGRLSSAPMSFTVSGPRVFFTADDSTNGRELWAFNSSTPPAAPVSATGAGWIATSRGKGHFQIQAKPKKGALDGKASFRLTGLDLRSRTLSRLTPNGATAWIEGEGTVNGRGSYLFRIAVTDGQAPGGGGTDRFRVRVWDPGTGATLFDSEPGAPDSSPPTTALGGGSIKIQASR